MEAIPEFCFTKTCLNFNQEMCYFPQIKQLREFVFVKLKVFSQKLKELLEIHQLCQAFNTFQAQKDAVGNFLISRILICFIKFKEKLGFFHTLNSMKNITRLEIFYPK
jgi:ACT domain-containing protein